MLKQGVFVFQTKNNYFNKLPFLSTRPKYCSLVICCFKISADETVWSWVFTDAK